MAEIIGIIDEKVVALLSLPIAPGTPILLGQTNIEHIKFNHPEDFDTYFNSISYILAEPDFVIPHPKEQSLQYIKILNDHVLVAVKLSTSGQYWVRTMFTMSSEKIERYTKGNLFNKYALKDKRPQP